MALRQVTFTSESVVPDFFRRVAARHHGLWKRYEAITALAGIVLIPCTLIGLTWFFASGTLPFMTFGQGGLSGLHAFAAVAGLVMGLCIHEFSHGVVLARNGIRIKRAGLMLGSFTGGFIEAEETGFSQAAPRVHLRFNAAGIGSNALTAALLACLGWVFPSGFLTYLAMGNLFFGVLNAFPVVPLDGGWVYEDLVLLCPAGARLKRIFLSARLAVPAIWLLLFTYSSLTYFS